MVFLWSKRRKRKQYPNGMYSQANIAYSFIVQPTSKFMYAQCCFHKQVLRYLFLFGQLQKFINTLCACIQTACPECFITQVDISHRCNIFNTGYRCCFLEAHGYFGTKASFFPDTSQSVPVQTELRMHMEIVEAQTAGIRVNGTCKSTYTDADSRDPRSPYACFCVSIMMASSSSYIKLSLPFSNTVFSNRKRK